MILAAYGCFPTGLVCMAIIDCQSQILRSLQEHQSFIKKFSWESLYVLTELFYKVLMAVVRVCVIFHDHIYMHLCICMYEFNIRPW